MLGELRGRDGAGVGKGVAGADEQLVVLVDHAGGSDRGGQVPCGDGDGVGGGVDRPRLDGSHCRVHVGVEGDDVQLDAGMRAVEALEQHRWGDPSTVYVDAQRPSTGAYGGVGARHWRAVVRG